MVSLHRVRSRRLPALAAGLLGGVLAAGAVGCGGSPATSSSDESATVRGVVTVDGKPATKGKITFDPSNANRRMASASSAPIGADGTYSLTTLVGRNMVTFELPGLATPKNRLNYSRLECIVNAGENTFDATLPPR